MQHERGEHNRRIETGQFDLAIGLGRVDSDERVIYQQSQGEQRHAQ